MTIHLKDDYRTKNASKNEPTWFLVELTNTPDVLHIVDQKIVELMLCNDKDGSNFDDYIKSANVDGLGWHIGNDSKMYVKHKTNANGLYWYKINKIEKKKKNFMLALDELNKGKNEEHLQYEKKVIKFNLAKNQISKISKYDGKELKPIAPDAKEQKSSRKV